MFAVTMPDPRHGRLVVEHKQRRLVEPFKTTTEIEMIDCETLFADPDYKPNNPSFRLKKLKRSNTDQIWLCPANDLKSLTV